MIVFVLVFLVFLALILLGCFYLFVKSHLNAIPANGIKPNKKFDAVTFHSYKPPKGIIPERGKRVAAAAVDWALHCGCLILLNVGHTVPGDPRMESEIYAQHIRLKINARVKIITGRDSDIRDTDREVKSCFKFCIDQGYKSLCVVAAYPHLGSRILEYWHKVNKGRQVDVTFVGVHVQPRIYLWELAMMLADKIFLPPGSKRREMLLSFIGRKG